MQDYVYEYGSERQPASLFRPWTIVQKLQIYQVCTASVHAVQAGIIGYFVLPPHGKTVRTPVYIPFKTWPDMDAPLYQKVFVDGKFCDGEIDIGLCIFAFFVLSAVFQLVSAWPLWNNYIDLLLDYYVQPWRWCEYSISAALMGVIYALLGGIQETTFIYTIFINFFAVMMCGLIQEINMSVIKRRQWELEEAGEKAEAPHGEIFSNVSKFVAVFLPHILGWIVFLSTISVFVVGFVLSTTRPGKPKPPSWVYGLYASQFVIMGSFAIVQLCEQLILLRAPTREACRRSALKAEFAYTTLSLVAKSSLCWVLYLNLIAESDISYTPLCQA